MQSKFVRHVVSAALSATLSALTPGQAGAQQAPLSPELIAQRERGRADAAVMPLTDNWPAVATGPEIISSLGLPPSTSPSVVQTGAAAAVGVSQGFGAIRPIRGTTMLTVSTGVASSTSPQPGTDFGAPGVADDRATVAVTFTVPAGMSRLNFWYRFMSAEFPEYVGSQFNDRLSISAIRSGVRSEVGRSSVNSAQFQPATTTTAGGTGYEISNGSQPIGGLTAWLPVVVDVAPGPMTLEFRIEDVGDGIYDSQVLVSSLGLASIETIDPAGSSLLTGVQFTSNVNLLASEGRPVRGAAADGVTRVLLRVAPASGTSVRFAIVGGSAADGGLTPVSGGTPQSEVVVNVVNTAAGPRALAVFLAPEDLQAPNNAERTIRLRATVTDSGETSESDFVLARPFLILMHGLWSNPQDAWGTSALHADPRFAGRVAGYPYNATAALSANAPRYAGFVRSALETYRGQGLAGTQVDLVGHSMGGVLARSYAQSAGYRRDDNFREGDFNRVITVNSPHQGSPWANILVAGHQNPIVGGMVDSGLTSLGIPYGLALEDLREGSAALQGIARADVRGHALAGTGGSDLVEVVGAVGTVADLLAHIPQPPLTRGVLQLMSFMGDTIETANGAVFGSRQHDLIVPLASEIGGMPTVRTGTFGGLSSIHTSATRAANYTQSVISLLNTAPNSASFGPFPAHGGSQSHEILQTAVVEPHVPPPTGLSASVSPTSLRAGQTVRVTVTALAGATPVAVFVSGPGVAVIDDAAPFVIDLVVPESHIGAFPISALGRQANGTFVSSNTATVQVTTTATLTSVSATPPRIVLTSVNATAGVEIAGQYSDNVIRTLTASGLVTFQSSNTAVATVSVEGVVTARTLGYAAISAAVGARSVSVDVVVNPYAGAPPPRADAGADQGVSPGSPVTLAGRALDVPSGLTPQYSWSQVAGPVAVTLSNPQIAAPSFVGSSAGSYVFSLIVRAGLSESQPDNVTVVVGPAAAPIVHVPPASVTVRQGETAALSVSATGISTPAFQWLKDGTPVAGATSPTLTIPNAQPAHAGAYSVRVANPSGTLFAGPATVTVCTFAVSTATVGVPGTGGAGSVTLTTGSGCPWTATSDAPWLTISSSASGTASGVVSWTASASPASTTRIASVTIGTAVVTFTQEPGVVLNVPGAPDNLVASQNGPQVTLVWDAPATGPAPLGYVIEVGTTPDGNELAPRATRSASTSFTLPISSGAYYMRVRGYTSSGQGSASNEVRVSFGGATAPPAAPGQLRARIDGSRLALEWTPTPAGYPSQGYLLEAGTSINQSDIAAIDTGTGQPAFAVGGVPPGQYFLRVRGRNTAGVSAPSNELLVQIGPLTCTAAPAAPVQLSPSLQGNVVSLTWLPPPGGASSYVLVAGTQPGQADLGVFDTGSSATSFVGPVPSGTYYTRIIARSACGDSAPSNGVAFTAGRAVAMPGRAVGLTITQGAGGVVVLTWHPPASGGSPTNYIVEAGSASGAADIGAASNGSTATAFSVAGLPPGRYFIRVRAQNSAGVGLPSNEFVLTVP